MTDRISLHNVSFGAADHQDNLSLEGDYQHWALVHHLTHRKLKPRKHNERPKEKNTMSYHYCTFDIYCT